jgi:hypothetical protein
MERLLIILAVLICVVAGVAVVGMSTRSRREPLRMGSELDAEDEHLLIGTVAPAQSVIDREAEVLHPRLLDVESFDLKPIPAPERTTRIAPLHPEAPDAGR